MSIKWIDWSKVKPGERPQFSTSEDVWPLWLRLKSDERGLNPRLVLVDSRGRDLCTVLEFTDEGIKVSTLNKYLAATAIHYFDRFWEFFKRVITGSNSQRPGTFKFIGVKMGVPDEEAVAKEMQKLVKIEFKK